jgi:hypothetical protein
MLAIRRLIPPLRTRLPLIPHLTADRLTHPLILRARLLT